MLWARNVAQPIHLNKGFHGMYLYINYMSTIDQMVNCYINVD